MIARQYARQAGSSMPPDTNHAPSVAKYCLRTAAETRLIEHERALLKLLSEVRKSPTSLKGAWEIVSVVEVMTL